MKKFAITITILAALFFTACEGPMGPPGYDGYDGDTFIGTIFDFGGDFRPANEYRLQYIFPSNLEIYDTDVVLVYILWETDNGLKIWRLMPQTVILNDGILQYNFDYTVNDVQVFLEGTTNFNNLLPAETLNQKFRIAVLPADYMAKNKIDINDFNSILTAPELQLNLPATFK